MIDGIALYLNIDNKKKFVGKHIGRAIYREFPFNKAKLRKGNAVGSDIRLIIFQLLNVHATATGTIARCKSYLKVINL